MTCWSAFWACYPAAASVVLVFAWLATIVSLIPNKGWRRCASPMSDCTLLSCRRTAALVSRRWHSCVHTPELCHEVVLFRSQPAALESLAAWLLRHGQHVRSLWLSTLMAAAEDEIGAQLTCCLMACVAGAVELLDIQCSTQRLMVAAWAPCLRSVRQLQLHSLNGDVVISSSLHGLTQLTSLSLGGHQLRFAATHVCPRQSSSSGSRIAPGNLCPAR